MTCNSADTLAVPPSRLAMGSWCHQTNEKMGEGDIYASYSADTISMGNKIRKPFRLDGWLYATVSISGTSDSVVAEAYRLIGEKHFNGVPKSYSEICRQTRSENGFYDGLGVTCGGQRFVLVGPPIKISASDEAEPAQGSLF